MEWRMCPSGLRILQLLVWLPLCSTPLVSESLSKLPAGTTLPVSLDTPLRAGQVKVGQKISAHLTQRVPLAEGRALPAKAHIEGTVTECDGHALALRFTMLTVGRQMGPIDVRLVAAAFWLDADHARDPLDGGDRGTSSPADWTTMQIGRDEVYRSGGSGTVYDQYSRPVGHADLDGVYAAPSGGAPPRAMGPFSTTATGLYDLPGFSIVSAGGNGMPVVLGLKDPKWRLDTATALLLEITGS